MVSVWEGRQYSNGNHHETFAAHTKFDWQKFTTIQTIHMYMYIHIHIHICIHANTTHESTAGCVGWHPLGECSHVTSDAITPLEVIIVLSSIFHTIMLYRNSFYYMMSNRLKVARYFDEDLYCGVVESIENDKYNIIYDDGDRESMDIDQVQYANALYKDEFVRI